MGKFSNRTRNLKKNKVAVSASKARIMKREAKLAKKDGDDVAMGEEPLQRVRGLAVKSVAKVASGELKNVPKVNEKKILRKWELPVREKKKMLDVPSGKIGHTPQFITKKKAKKLYKKMTHDARDMYRKMKEEAEANGEEFTGLPEEDGEEMES